jgi:hypothetical protein
MPDELVVYDLEGHRAHCLNQSAAFVWKHCDGQTNVADLTALLTEELGEEINDEVVWLALDQLSKLKLLEEHINRPPDAIRLSRRAAVKRLGMAAALLPLVISITAPTPAQAQSPCNAENCPPPRCCQGALCAPPEECDTL